MLAKERKTFWPLIFYEKCGLIKIAIRNRNTTAIFKEKGGKLLTFCFDGQELSKSKTVLAQKNIGSRLERKNDQSIEPRLLFFSLSLLKINSTSYS